MIRDEPDQFHIACGNQSVIDLTERYCGKVEKSDHATPVFDKALNAKISGAATE